MNYVTEMYLDYLNNAVIYEGIYTDYVFDLILKEAPADAGINPILAQIKQLQSQRAGVTDPAQLSQINAQISQLQGQVSNVATQAAPSVAPTQAPVRTTPGGQATGMPGGEKTGAATSKPAPPQPGGQATGMPGGEKTGAATSKPADAPVAADTPVPGGDVSTMGQVKQGASDAADKVKDAAGTVAGKVKDADTAIKGALPDSAQQALDTVGSTAGQAAQTVAGKVGVSPDTAGAIGSAVQAVGGSPLGLAALGGAAAYGGYKLYKRFLSKSAGACRGYSGADKTSCMKSYMDAKRNQAQSRGTAVAAT